MKVVHSQWRWFTASEDGSLQGKCGSLLLEAGLLEVKCCVSGGSKLIRSGMLSIARERWHMAGRIIASGVSLLMKCVSLQLEGGQ